MTHPAEQLKALGISLPPVSTPAAAYDSAPPHGI